MTGRVGQVSNGKDSTLLVRIHFIIEMIWWTGLAPWEFEFPLQVALRLPSYRGELTYSPTYTPQHAQACVVTPTVGHACAWVGVCLQASNPAQRRADSLVTARVCGP